MIKPQLVLDIGGVIATNLSPGFWHQLSNAADVPSEPLYRAYKQQISASLWNGEITENDFWNWLNREMPHLQLEAARAFLSDNLTPLPAWHSVQGWSELADVHILSNHRAEWVRPMLAPIIPYLTTVTISSEIGCRKPQADSFLTVERRLPPGSAVLFVDDQMSNLQAAKQHGWSVLLADDRGEWISQVPDLLNSALETVRRPL